MVQLVEGTAVPPLRKRVYQRMLVEESFAEDSVHQGDYALAKGYPGALVSAYVITGYVTELMVRCFGEDWLSSGSFNLKFIGTGLQQGDDIDVHAVVRSANALEDGREHLTLEVWIEQLHSGAKNVIGEASCIRAPVSASTKTATRPNA